MNRLDSYEYISQIPAEPEDAIAVQRLTLQDVVAGGFTDPKDIANPDDPVKVQVQIDKLTHFPEKYSGYRQENGVLVAYVKSSEWLAGDEAPFIDTIFSRNALKAAAKLRGGSLNPRAYGVFGLVVADTLPEDHQEALFEDLLTRSIGKATLESAAVVNIVLHDSDPVERVVTGFGFKPVGPLGVAAGAPGKMQQRYQLTLPRND